MVLVPSLAVVFDIQDGAESPAFTANDFVQALSKMHVFLVDWVEAYLVVVLITAILVIMPARAYVLVVTRLILSRVRELSHSSTAHLRRHLHSRKLLIGQAHSLNTDTAVSCPCSDSV